MHGPIRGRAHTPWYREPWMWLVVALPVTAVVAGLATLRLAIVSDDGLVVDDYYPKGRAINQVFYRDRQAASHGLRGELRFDFDTGSVQLRLAADPAYAPPAALALSMLHPTRAGLDQSLTLLRTPDGGYFGLFPRPAGGNWHVLLEADDWRLVGRLDVPAQTRVRLQAAGG